MVRAGLGRLTVVVCGAGPAMDVAVLIESAMAASWTVGVVATPSAVPFLDIPLIEGLTKSPVRSWPRDPHPSQQRGQRDAKAYLVAPATFNTINKLAVGIADNYALTLLAEAIGSRAPMVLVPFVNEALAARQPYRSALASLRCEGVRILEGERDGWLPHPPGTGTSRQRDFPWSKALSMLEELATAVEPGA